MFGQSLLSGAFGTAIIFVPDENFSTKLFPNSSSSPMVIGGKLNGAGSFNASSSYVKVNDPIFDSTSNSDLTWSCWIKFDSTFTSSFRAVVGSTQSSGLRGAIAVNMYGSASGISTALERYYSNTQRYSNAYATAGLRTYDVDVWYHQAIVYTGSNSTATVYIDGVQVGSPYVLDNVNSQTTVNETSFGIYSNSGYGWHGEIDQIRCYPSALSTAQINELYTETSATANTLDFPTGAGCIAAYTLDNYGNTILSTEKLSTCDFPSGASCEALYEFNGNGNDTCGTHNATVKNTTFGAGLFNKAAIFNGSTSEIEYPSLGTVFQNNYSISAWFRLEAYTSSGNPGYDLATVVSTFSDYYGWVAVNSVTNKLKYYTEYLNAPPWGYGIESTTTINLNQWYHMAVTKSSTGGMKLYLNGVLENTESAATQNLYSTSGISYKSAWGSYGEVANSYSMFTGQIDQGRIFNSVLTQAQVTELSRGEPKYNGASNDVTYPGYTKFGPDLTWVKSRGFGYPNILADSVRGTGNNKMLISDYTGSEGDTNNNYANAQAYGYISSLEDYGFSNASGTTNGSFVGANGSGNYVSWNWKAGADTYAIETGSTSTSYADIPSSLVTPASSISFWFKAPATDGNWVVMVGSGGESSSGTGWALFRSGDGGYLNLYFTNGQTGYSQVLIGTTVVTDNKWHHIVLSMASDDTFVLYLDNVSHLSGTRTRWTQSDTCSVSNIRFGNNSMSTSSGNQFSGQFDQVRTYTGVALTSSQVTSLYNESVGSNNTLDFPTGAGCSAVYPFNKNVNPVLNESNLTTCNFPTGAGCQALYQFNNAVTDTCGSYNGTATNITYAGGVFNFTNSAVFNGSSSYVTAAVSHSNTFSVSAWVYPKSHSYQLYYQARQDSANFVQMGQDTTGGNGTLSIANKVGNTWNVFYTASEPLATLNQWYHIVVNFSSSDAKIYVNGSFVESHNVFTTSPTYSVANIGVTNTTSYSGYWDGYIDQLRTYNAALTQAQVTELGRGYHTATPNEIIYAKSGYSGRNNDGSIESQVSANQDAGFSIIKYKGVQPGSGNVSTIGHGLKKSPELIITKVLNSTNGWPTLYYKGSDKFCVRLNQSNANDTNNLTLFYGDGTNAVAPTSSVYTVGNSDEVNYAYEYIAYVWHSVDKYSQIGTYTATQTAGSPTITTDFEPAWVMLKNVDRNQEWIIIDSERGNNPGQTLRPDNPSAEYAGNSIIFNSTGFVINTTGQGNNYATGETFIYMAFAK